MKKILALVLALVLCLGLMSACGQAAEPAPVEAPAESAPVEAPAEPALGPVQLTFATASTGSVDYTTGALLCTLFETYLPDGSKLTQETIATGNSTTGYLIEAGSCDIARGQNAVSATVGIDGRAPYSNVRALCGLYTPNLICQIFTQKFVDKSGYTSLREVVENKYPIRIVCEEVGSTDYIVLNYILESLGVTVADIESWGGSVTYTGGSTEVEMLQDGQADLMIPHTSITSSTVAELTLSTDVQIYPFDEEILQFFKDRGFGERTIPAGTFGFFEQDAPAIGMGTSLIVSADMPDTVAYELTKIICEHAEEDLGEDNVAFTNLNWAMLCSSEDCVVPFHPGSIQYFVEQGVMDANGNFIG